MNDKEELKIDVENNTIRLSVSPLVSHDITLDGKRFAPKEDITPLESVRIAQLLVLLTYGHYISENYSTTFIEKYKLERHFEDI